MKEYIYKIGSVVKAKVTEDLIGSYPDTYSSLNGELIVISVGEDPLFPYEVVNPRTLEKFVVTEEELLPKFNLKRRIE